MSDIFINTFNPEREIQGERQSQPKRLAETAGSSELSSTALEEKPSVVKIFFNEYMYTYTHKNAYQMMLTPAAHVHLFLKIFCFKYDECFEELHCWCDESGPL